MEMPVTSRYWFVYDARPSAEFFIQFRLAK